MAKVNLIELYKSLNDKPLHEQEDLYKDLASVGKYDPGNEPLEIQYHEDQQLYYIDVEDIEAYVSGETVWATDPDRGGDDIEVNRENSDVSGVSEDELEDFMVSGDRSAGDLEEKINLRTLWKQFKNRKRNNVNEEGCTEQEIAEGTCGYGKDGKIGKKPAGPKKVVIALQERLQKNRFKKLAGLITEQGSADPNLSDATGCADPCAINYQRPVVISYVGNNTESATEDDLADENNYIVEDWNGNNGDPFIVGCNGTIYGNQTGEGYWYNIWAIAGLPVTMAEPMAAAIAMINPLTLIPMVLGAIFGSGTNEVQVGFGDVGNTLLALNGLSGPELNDFCYNPNSTQGNIPGLSAALNISGPTSWEDLPTGDVIITGPQQTQALLANQQNYEGQLSGQTIDITCCNYDKDYMRLLGMGPGVPTTSGIDDKPADLDLDPTLGISSCEDYCGNGGWELVPNIDIISEQQMGPEIGINACSNESECLEGCFANNAQNPQLWCTGGSGQDSQQASPSIDRMKKLAFHNKKR